ncbi:MAG: type II toxin-antitoxin system mRNA interferase toxin, RelE/StbE family [Deltaproteobacteria bacterium]|nr:type II toxin-antitoxin system mRNA interferase toxin, RelE/StbE family [Deltaproteobacteria bacterium]
MKRKLLKSTSFIRASKKLIKKSPVVAEDLFLCLRQLEEDAFHPSLKTHKLKGVLDGSLAASVGYNLRIIFSLVDYQGFESILLQTIGTHDEVY